MTPHVVTLLDPATESRARILIGRGFNCDHFSTRLRGQTIDAIWAAPGFAAGTEHASGSGIPILFPFPGRIQGTEFRWQGRAYPLSEGDGRGNAIHGFVHERPWRVTSQSERHVTGEFQASIDDPALLDHWPADFRLVATYRLEGHQLLSQFTAHNPGDQPLPCGLGTHPYFRTPLGTRGSAAECRLELPVSGQWELHEMNATGRRFELEDAASYQQGFALGPLRFDNVFTGLVATDGWCRARVVDPPNQCALEIAFQDVFRECVVYTPGHRESVCIEPYSCVPDAARLQAMGVDAGLWVLAPGAERRAEVNLTVLPRDAAS